MRHRTDAGFTLLEVMMVAAIMIIVAAIAIPNMMRARLAGSEASAIGSVRAVIDGQAVFASSCGSGFYAPTLVRLSTGVTPTSPGFVGPELAADPIVKSSYLVTLTAGVPAGDAPASCNGEAAGALARSYFVSASPITVGGRFFGANQGGAIFESDGPMAVTQNGMPAGARPLQ